MSCIFDQTDMTRIHLHQVDSTNSALRESLADSTSEQMIGEPGQEPMALPEYFTVTARYQTAGRGQRGNSWESEEGKNLLMSTLLRPEFLPVSDQFRLSQVVSLAAVETLEKLAPEEKFTVKWPNDIYHGDRKICGMLLENDLSGDHLVHTIVGIGWNINQEEFHSDAPNPCSLIQIIGEETHVDTVLSIFFSRLKKLYARLQSSYASGESSDWLDALYAARLYRGDGAYYDFRDSDGPFRASIRRVNPDGRLYLCRQDGTERGYYFKEVEYLLPAHL